MSVSIAVKVFVVVLVTLTVWSLIRKTMMKSIHPYFDSNDIEQEDEEIEYGESLESLKTILDETYVSVIKILDESESAKSVIELEKGLKHLKEAIKQRNVLAGEDPGRLPKIEKVKKELKDPGEICPEKYQGAKQDYPLYLNNIPLDPTCKVPPLNSLVTITFNFVNEIPASQAEELFEDAAFGMYKDMTFLAFLKKDAKQIPNLKKIAKAKLPNMHIVEQQESAQTHADVLEEMAKNVKTKYIVLTRNTERFDNFSTIIRLVRDISLGKAEIIAGSHRNTSGHWRAGCYQMKQRLGEMALDEGYDFSDNACMFCDYVSGPFGIKTEVLLKYLETVKDSPLKTYQFYMEMFFHFRLQMKKKIMMCIDSMFYTVTSGLLPLDKASWMPYLKRNKISKIVFPRKVITHEATCKEVDLQCAPDKDKNLPFCCYREIEEVLSAVSKFLQDNKIQYHFCLPDDKTVWKKLYMENPARNVILVSVSSVTRLSELKLEGFSWSYSDYEFSSDQWKIVFQQETSFPSESIKIRFNKLLLNVDQNPGKAMAKYGKTACTRDKICFDLLHYHGPLDTQKVWM